MPDFDLIVRATSAGGGPISVGIYDEKFAAVAPELEGSASRELDHPEAILFPGWIDAHVHFNEPGRSDWEGISTGSRALALGGGTTFFDMPLNSTPPVLNRAALEEKARIAREKSSLDFALWGGLTPDSLDHLAAMGESGAIGFKAFLCHSGLDEFATADPRTLKKGMQIAASLGLPVAVHAELDPTGERPPGNDMNAWFKSRPIQLELDAIALATELAGETGCALHVVHVSSPEGIDWITEAKKAGVDVTAETCPHYLLLNETIATKIGASAKCAPPVRSESEVAELWERLQRGDIDTIGSDHSPSPPEMKTGEDIFAIWGGIAGIQHGLPLILDHDLSLGEQISDQVAKRFRLPGKGGLKVGNDADFFLLEPKSHKIVKSELVTRHQISPYCGMTMRHRILTTYLRGKPVTAESRGEFLKPNVI